MTSFFRKKIFLNSLEKIITHEDYSCFISFFKDSSFEEFISKNKIDLTINNNFFIKKIISEKKFSFLDFFWHNKEVNSKLKNESPEMYNYCALYYHIDDAISENNIDNLKKLLENSFENSLFNEGYFYDAQLLKAVDEEKKEIVTILLEDGRFNINAFDGYTIRHAILNDYKDIFLLLLNNKKIHFDVRIIDMIFAYYTNKELKIDLYFFERLIENKEFLKHCLSHHNLNVIYNKILNQSISLKIDKF